MDIPFELHVTVDADDVEAFRTACVALHVKPLLIAMQTSIGKAQELMTSSTIKGDDATAIAETDRIVRGLEAAGFRVVRRKIEAAWWHPDAPSIANGRRMDAGQYFECHLGVRVNREDLASLKAVARASGLHLSRNAFKASGNTEIRMATLRSYDGVVEDFRSAVAKARSVLEMTGFDVEREIVEFAWFDSRPAFDAAWLAANDNTTSVRHAA